MIVIRPARSSPHHFVGGSYLLSSYAKAEKDSSFNGDTLNLTPDETGASNLTPADPNEKAANSQALSIRQSITVPALALANQSQQSVLQLLR